MNILWLMTDEQRKDSLGLYGSSWAQTPNLDRLAAQGAVCENALTGSPVCVPARTSILTGRYPHSTGVWHNTREKHDYRSLTDIVHAVGYQSATFGKQHHALADRCFQHVEGLSETHQATHFFYYREPYDGTDYDMVQFPGVFPWVLAGRYPEGEETKVEYKIVDRAIEWLDKRDADRPFLLRCSFPGPHTPVTPPVPYDRAIDPDAINFPPEVETRMENLPRWLDREWALTNSADLLTQEQVSLMRRHYYGFVSFLDAQFGRLLNALDERGLLEDTVIGFVSDHGTLLGDYGFVQKGTYYEPDAGVPMFFAGPGVNEGARISTPVSSVSFLSTLLELAGLEVPAYDGPVSDAPLDVRPDDDRARIEEPSLAEAVRSGEEPEPHLLLSEITLVDAGERAGKQFGPYRGYRHGLPRVLVRDRALKCACALTPDPDEFLVTDLESDPLEVENQAHNEAYRDRLNDVASWLRGQLHGQVPWGYNQEVSS